MISPRTFFKETARARFSSATEVLLKKLPNGRYSGCGVDMTAKWSTTTPRAQEPIRKARVEGQIDRRSVAYKINISELDISPDQLYA